MNKEKLKQLVGDFSNDFRKACDKSREEYMKTLAPGQTVPKAGQLYTKEARDAFANKCNGYRQQATSIFDEAAEKLDAEITKPPTNDEVNTVTMLKMRSSLSASEADSLLTSNRGNVQTYRAIKDIAAEHGHKGFRDHPVDQAAANLKDLQSNVMSYFSVQSAEKGHASGSFASIITSMIDGADD